MDKPGYRRTFCKIGNLDYHWRCHYHGCQTSATTLMYKTSQRYFLCEEHAATEKAIGREENSLQDDFPDVYVYVMDNPIQGME